MSRPVRHHWLDRATQVYRFHAEQLKDNPKWTLQMTADTLNRSIGSVSQDLLLASWGKTNESQLKRFSSMKDALAYVRAREHEIKTAL